MPRARLTGAIAAATASLDKRSPSATFSPGQFVVEQYVLTNPALNYAQFLLRAILPTVLHVVVAISGGYASDQNLLPAAGGLAGVRRRQSADRACRQTRAAICIFCLIMVAVAAVHPWRLRGSVPRRRLDGRRRGLPVVARLFVLGALFPLLVRNLPLGLSLTGSFARRPSASLASASRSSR